MGKKTQDPRLGSTTHSRPFKKVAPARTSTSAATNLLSRLRQLLQLADAVFKGGRYPSFPESLLEIPKLIEDLQPFLKRKHSNRAPFWKCVAAVDHNWPGLALIPTLDALVDRATSIEPGPLVRLLNLADEGKLSSEEDRVVREIQKQTDAQLEQTPDDLRRWAPIVEKVASSDYARRAKALRRVVPPTLRPKEIDEFLFYTAYLDFAREHELWLARNLPALEPLILLLDQLENENYDKLRNRILRGDVANAKLIREGHAARQAAKRQRAYRKRQVEAVAAKLSARRRKRAEKGP